jgi:hypothetical protein
MMTTTTAPITLYNEFKATRSIDKKVALFKAWLEAMVKLNTSIHVGWLIKHRGNNAPGRIKAQLVAYFQKPPSIGSGLALSRSINKEMQAAGPAEPVISAFHQLYHQYDPIFSRLLEQRNADAHAVHKIDKGALEDIAADMRLITLNPFYTGLELTTIALREHLQEMGMIADKTAVAPMGIDLRVPVLRSNSNQVNPGTNTHRDIPLFPLAVADGEGYLYFWNQRKSEHGQYSTYTTEARALSVKNITAIAGFPYEDWKRSTDPLYMKYLDVRARALEELPDATDTPLRTLADELHLARRMEAELNLQPHECISELQWLSTLHQRTTTEQDPDTKRYYLTYIVEQCGNEGNGDLKKLLLDSLVRLIESESDSRKVAGHIAYFFKEYVLTQRCDMNIQLNGKDSAVYLRDKLVDKYKYKHKSSFYIAKSIPYILVASILLFIISLIISNYYLLSISILILITCTSYLIILTRASNSIISLKFWDVNFNTSLSYHPIRLFFLLYQLLVNNLRIKSALFKILSSTSDPDTLFGQLVRIYLGWEINAIVHNELNKIMNGSSHEELNNLINKIHTYFFNIKDIETYLEIICRIVGAYINNNYFEQARHDADVFSMDTRAHLKIGGGLPRFDSAEINRFQSAFIEGKWEDGSTMDRSYVARSLNKLEVVLWICAIRTIYHEPDTNKAAEMKAQMRHLVKDHTDGRAGNGTWLRNPDERLACGHIWQPADPSAEAKLRQLRGLWLLMIGMYHEAKQDFETALDLSDADRLHIGFKIAHVEAKMNNAEACLARLKRLKRDTELLEDDERKRIGWLPYLDTNLAAFTALDPSLSGTMPSGLQFPWVGDGRLWVKPEKARTI